MSPSERRVTMEGSNIVELGGNVRIRTHQSRTILIHNFSTLAVHLHLQYTDVMVKPFPTKPRTMYQASLAIPMQLRRLFHPSGITARAVCTCPGYDHPGLAFAVT
jgi:hypothetical protein